MKKVIAMLAALLTCMGLAAQNNKEEDVDLQYAVDLLKPGTQAPDFALQDIQGKTWHIKDFQGRKVVLVFWASWCPDCRAEVPELKALHASANPEKVAFVSVSFDRTLEALQTYVAENYLPGVQLYDPAGKKESKVAADYGVKWIPSLYLLDQQGKVELGTVLIGKIAKALGGGEKAAVAKHEFCSDESCAL